MNQKCKEISYKVRYIFIRITKNKIIIIFLINLILIFFLIKNYFIFKCCIKKNMNNQKFFEFYIEHQFDNLKTNEYINLDYENINFAILKRTTCPDCGLFSYYIIYLGCIRKYMIEGYIPIIDLESFPNVFNGFNINSSRKNPWEIFFYQPFGYTIRNVMKRAKNINYFECENRNMRPNDDIFFDKKSMNLWHNIANKYIPIKNKIIKDSENIIKKLFKDSTNVLGVLLRGTDYMTKKPYEHPIIPNTDNVIEDVIKMDNKNKYDFIFIATEDNRIRNKFIKSLKNKLKYLIYEKNIDYNYTKKDYFAYNKNVIGNLEFVKIYLLNMLILSKCIDIISAQTSGSIGVFILSNGFRNNKVYNLGYYKL